MHTFFVYVTAKDSAEAQRIARAVVTERLAACANILGSIHSVYWWNDEVCEDEEVSLILKTTEENRAGLIDRVKELHSYDVPCVVCLPVTDGNPDFLQWIQDEAK